MLHESCTLVVDRVQRACAWKEIVTDFRPEVVVHLAAETGTAQSLTESARHAEVNVLGTARMLDAFSEAAWIPKHFILSSSRAVYGEGAWLDRDGRVLYPDVRRPSALSSGKWDPTAPDGSDLVPLPHDASKTEPRPVSIYGATKLTQEHLLKNWCAAYERPLTILRFQNVFGPGQSPTNAYTGIVTLFHRQAAAGQRIHVYEDGRIVRDFVYIDDVVKTLLQAVDNPPAVLRTIDVGTGRALTVHEIARTIALMYGAPEPIITGQFRNGDVRSAFCNAKAMREELGVEGAFSFEEGSRRLGAWLAAQNL